MSTVSLDKVDTSESVWLTPITIDTKSKLYTFAEHIKQTSLPETEQPVVIVAEVKEEGNEQQIIYKGDVWKASQVEEPAPPPIEVPENDEKKTSLSPATATAVSPPQTRLLVIGIILLLAILIAIWLIAQAQFNTLHPDPTPTPTAVPTEVPK